MFLLPPPVSIQMGGSHFNLTPYTVIVLTQGSLLAAKQLQDEIRLFGGMECPIIRGQGRPGDIVLGMDEALKGQAYSLCISQEGVMLRGGEESGLLHGVQTLRQIIRQRGLVLPCLHIEDEPSYPVRGYYFDVSRGRVSTLEALKRLADDMCFYKLNTLQLYVEHTYLFRDFSEVWHDGTPLTAEEIMALDAYCADRGIELVPSLACFGHMYEILCREKYQALCELEDPLAFQTYTGRMRHHTINAADPRSYALVTGMIEEFMPLFITKKFNICCDETFDLGKGRGKATMEETGKKDFYTGFVKELCRFVLSKGATPMMWGDIILHFPEAIQDLPKEVIFLNWGYDANQREKETATFAQYGAKQYVCPGLSSWNQFVPRLKDSYDNITRMAAYGRKHGALGLLNTDWGDYGHVANPMLSLPGMIYGAAFSWAEIEMPFEEINRAVSRLAYLDESEQLAAGLDLINQGVIYTWSDLVEYLEEGRALNKQGGDRAKLLEGLQTLTRCVTHMDSQMKPVVFLALLAGEAVDICNELGACIQAGQKAPGLAVRIENWFYRYKQTWRQTAKEGDLAYLSKVLARFAEIAG